MEGNPQLVSITSSGLASEGLVDYLWITCAHLTKLQLGKDELLLALKSTTTSKAFFYIKDIDW